MNSRIIITVFFGLAIPVISSAGGYNTFAPKYSNEFLSIGVGARALALGNSQIATTGDVMSAYWNPSGLTYIASDRQVSLMHNSYFAGIANYDYAALAAPVDHTRTMAFSIIRFGIDDIPDTSELVDANGNIDYDRIKTFSAVDWAFLFSYGQLTKISGLRAGGSAKVIRRKAGDFAGSWGFGIDVAAQYNIGTWKFGATLRDASTTFNAWSFNTEKLADVFARTQNELPDNSLELTLPKLLVGAGKKFFLSKNFTLLPETDFDVTFDGKRNVPVKSGLLSIDPHLGVEFGYGDFIFMRGGINNFQQLTNMDGTKTSILQPNIGVGVKIKSFTVDYALTNLGQSAGLYSNVFSLKIDINKRAGSQNQRPAKDEGGIR